MKKIKNFRKILSIVLSMIVLFNFFTVVASAAIGDGNLCEHHTQHNAECGYVEGESECSYECDECTVIIKPTIASGTSEWTTNPEPEMVSVTHHSEYDISWYTSNTEAETFYIDDAQDLVGLMLLVNYGPDGVWDSENQLFTNGTSSSDNVKFEGKTIELRSDIKLNGDYNVLNSDGKLDLTNVDNLKKWKPINYFKGTFDGKNHTISGIYMPLVKDTYTADSALFGRLSGATIKNVKITDSYLYGSSKYQSSEVYVGGLVAHMTNSTIDNCIVDARIIADCPDINTRYQNAGGVVAYVAGFQNDYAVIKNCEFKGDIVTNVTSVGGILGRTYESIGEVTIENCVNNGYIENNVYKDYNGIGTGCYFATAGIFGYGSAKIKNCINYGTVKGMRSYIGGVAGKTTSVEGCKNFGTVTQVDNFVATENSWTVCMGGIAASCSSITDCVNGSADDSTLGNIIAIAYYGYLGGIAGETEGNVTGCINYAPIKDNKSKYTEAINGFYAIGGIVGEMSPLKVDIAITDCVNYGDLSGSGEETDSYSTEKIGGIIGFLQISNSSYYYGNVTVSECINKGDIISSGHAGGINGYSTISYSSTYKGRLYITNCYNEGDITSTGTKYFSYAGGINGYSSSTSSAIGPIVSCVYNIGTVSCGYEKGKPGGVSGNNHGTYTNSYYLDTAALNSTTKGTAMTIEQFNSGEVAYLLQEGQTATDENGEVIHIWGQYIDKEPYPVLNGKKVYKTTRCDNGEIAYSNTTDAKHEWDEEGFCLCGAYEFADYNAEDDIYEIGNAGQLYWFAEQVNAGNTGYNAILLNDIVINENVLVNGELNTDADAVASFRQWKAMGSSSNGYVGTFDGQGYEIKGLYMNTATKQDLGLFGYLLSGAVVKNLGVVDGYLADTSFNSNYACGDSCDGGVIARYSKEATISRCYNTCTIMAGGSVGGIVGSAFSTRIEYCYNNGEVTCTAAKNAPWYPSAGGIVGSLYSTATSYEVIYSCYNSGEIGGGYSWGRICGSRTGYNYQNCYYLYDTDNGNGGKTAEQFASGEVAYLLQQGNTEQVWGQQSNQTGAMPVFDATGLYKVVKLGSGYSVANIGDTNADGIVDVQDYQALVNTVLADNHEQIEMASYDDIIRYDLDGDGYLDVIDASLMHNLINGFATADVYAVGDYDCNGKAFEEADLKAIRHAIENPEKLSTAEKYASDINGDGKVDESDLAKLNARYGEIAGVECEDNVKVYYRWGNSYTTCTATAMCTLCNKNVATETVKTTSETLSELTCTQDGEYKYTATFTNKLFETKINEVTVKAKGHNYTEYIVNENNTHTKVCGCGYEETEDHNYEVGTCVCNDEIFKYNEATNTISVDNAEYVQSAVDAAETVGTAENPATIVLLTDIAITDATDSYGIEIESGNIKLDLNGHTINYSGFSALKICSDAVVTVVDSGTGGSICSKDAGIYNDGTLTVAGGNISGKSFGIYNYGMLNISGGTISSNHITICKGTVRVSGVPVLECYPDYADPCHLYDTELIIECDMTGFVWNYYDSLNYTLAEGGIASDSNFVSANEGLSLNSDLTRFEKVA